MALKNEVEEKCFTGFENDSQGRRELVLKKELCIRSKIMVAFRAAGFFPTKCRDAFPVQNRIPAFCREKPCRSQDRAFFGTLQLIYEGIRNFFHPSPQTESELLRNDNKIEILFWHFQKWVDSFKPKE